MRLVTKIKQKIFFLVLGLMTCWLNTQAATQNISFTQLAANKTHQPSSAPTLIPPEPQLAATGYVLMDATMGKVLAQKNMNQRMPPASLTKMMTLYLAFQAIQSGQIHLNDSVRISEKAWRMTGSRMFLKVGTEVTTEQLILGVIVASGNDACVALAQYIGGTEETFAALMNQMAKKLGMNDTHYVDSTGLPDPEQYTTPHDMALLARALIKDFPEYYHYFNEKWLTYNNIKQPNRNRLLWRDPSVDGLKTGHTDDAGYCLVASAERNNMRLISVMMGAPSDGIRASNSEALLNYGFRFYKAYQLFSANQVITKTRVWLGKEKFIDLGLQQPLSVTILASDYDQLKASMSLENHLTAPIVVGKPYGNIIVTLNEKVVATVPLVALQNNPKAGFFSRIIDHLSMLVKG